MNMKIYFSAMGIALLAACSSPQMEAPPAPEKQLFADAQTMQTALAYIQAGDSLYLSAWEVLRAKADEALAQGPFSVMEKTQNPPSGNKHDYMSQGPYWWPDPAKPDGLPYIRRDGEVNPESRGFTDHQYLGQLIGLTETLGKAWYFSGEEKYAAHAATLIRAWFLDEATRMNPHLNYGQAIPGRTEGRGIGIIETRSLGLVIDAINLIRNSGHWSETDESAMQAWCRDYLDWLLNSPHGRDEAIQHNNHGTWYDVQAAALALYSGQPGIATELTELAKTRRLDAHIAADGGQPHEIARTRSWDYSSMNLWGLFQIARLADGVDADLWHYPAADESKLRKGLDYLLPFALGAQTWPHEQITPFHPEKLLPHLQVAARVFPDGGYAEAAAAIRSAVPDAGDVSILWE